MLGLKLFETSAITFLQCSVTLGTITSC